MKFFVKIVLTGFGLAMGGALFKKVAPHLNLDDKGNAKKDDNPDLQTEGGAPVPHGHGRPHHAN